MRDHHGREIDVRVAARRHLAHLLLHRLHGAVKAAHLVVLGGILGGGGAGQEAGEQGEDGRRMVQSSRVRRRVAFAITETELSAMAAAASIGFRRMPNSG